MWRIDLRVFHPWQADEFSVIVRECRISLFEVNNIRSKRDLKMKLENQTKIK
jgi:hypothetical protein